MSDFYDEMDRLEEERDLMEYEKSQAYNEGYNKAIDDFSKALCKAFNDTTIIESGYIPNNVVRLVAGEMREAVKNNGMDSM